jgi:hypothetical protein
MDNLCLFHFQMVIGGIDFIKELFIHSIALLAPKYKNP